MKLIHLSFVVFIAACAHTSKNYKYKTSNSKQHRSVTAVQTEPLDLDKKLESIEPVKEKIIPKFFDKKVGLFVNSENPIAYRLVQDAQKTIDIEIYEMKDPKFRNYIIDALKRKVVVRIVKDSNTVGDSCNELEPVSFDDDPSCADEKNFVTQLQSLGAKYVFFNKKELCGIQGRSCFQHGKMIIADNKYLLLSTGNFNSSSFCNLEANVSVCNRDYSYVTTNPKVIQGLRQLLERDLSRGRWDFREEIANGVHHGVTVSPVSRPKLLSLIDSARNSIWVQNQYLEDPVINDLLMEKAKQGVKVNVMVAAFCNYGEPSTNKKAKIEKIYSAFEAAGVNTKIFNSKMKINGKNGYLHAKAIIVDNTLAWIGSINGSETSTTQNREFGIIFNTRKPLRKLLDVVMGDFNHPQAMNWKDSLECLN